MQDITEIMARLNPKTRQRVQAATEVKIRKQKTPSVGLNSALRGGIGYGRQTLFWGSKSAGKTSLLLQTIAKAQQEGQLAALIDAENSFDPDWSAKLGVDNSRLILSQVKTTEDMVSVVTELMAGEVGIVGVDSISSLLPSSYFEKDDNELKHLNSTKQIGTESRDLANAVKMLNYANKETALILISQIRNKITTYGASSQPTGGHAVDFFSSTVVKLTSSYRADDQIKGQIAAGNKIIDVPIGRKVIWNIDKNKLGPPSLSGDYDFYYDGDHIGVDNVGETLDVAERMGIVIKSGAWFAFLDQKLQGRQKSVEWLRNNPDGLNTLQELIDEQSV